MKHAEDIMRILEAFDLTCSYRAAGELAGCDHHTVAQWVARRDAGELTATPVRRPQLIDVFLPKLPLREVPHVPLMRDALSLRDNLTFYDALYVVLARRALGARVVTADRGLAAAPGVAPHVQLLAVT